MRQDWCSRGNCQNAAAPGTSSHGWGTAVDFAQMELSTPNYNWLKSNAGRFGWFHPVWAEPNGSAPEAWHREFRR